MSGRDRAQAYTLEGLIAAILVASAVLYGLQAVDVAPYTEDRSDRDLDAFRTQVGDSLGVLGDAGALREAVTCLNTTSGAPRDGMPDVQVGQPPDDDSSDGDGNVTAVGHVLNQSLGINNREYIVVFDYWNESRGPDGAVDPLIVYPNTTSQSRSFSRETVTSTYRVAVYDSTPVHEVRDDPRSGVEASCRPTDQTLEARDSGSDPLYLPESSTSNGPLYNVVTVRVIAW